MINLSLVELFIVVTAFFFLTGRPRPRFGLAFACGTACFLVGGLFSTVSKKWQDTSNPFYYKLNRR